MGTGYLDVVRYPDGVSVYMMTMAVLRALVRTIEVDEIVVCEERTGERAIVFAVPYNPVIGRDGGRSLGM